MEEPLTYSKVLKEAGFKAVPDTDKLEHKHPLYGHVILNRQGGWKHYPVKTSTSLTRFDDRDPASLSKHLNAHVAKVHGESVAETGEVIEEAVFQIKDKTGEVHHTTTNKSDAESAYHKMKDLKTDPTTYTLYKNGKVHMAHVPATESTETQRNTTSRYIDHPKHVGQKVLNPNYVKPETKKTEYVDHPTKVGVKVRKEDSEVEVAAEDTLAEAEGFSFGLGNRKELPASAVTVHKIGKVRPPPMNDPEAKNQSALITHKETGRHFIAHTNNGGKTFAVSPISPTAKKDISKLNRYHTSFGLNEAEELDEAAKESHLIGISADIGELKNRGHSLQSFASATGKLKGQVNVKTDNARTTVTSYHRIHLPAGSSKEDVSKAAAKHVKAARVALGGYQDYLSPHHAKEGEIEESVELAEAKKWTIQKWGRAPGKISGLAGQTIAGLQVKDVYTDKNEAKKHLDHLNLHGSASGYELHPVVEGVEPLGETPSEYQMHGLGIKPAVAMKKFKLRKANGDIHSQHDTESSAMAAYSSHPANKGMKITRESVDGSEEEMQIDEDGGRWEYDATGKPKQQKPPVADEIKAKLKKVGSIKPAINAGVELEGNPVDEAIVHLSPRFKAKLIDSIKPEHQAKYKAAAEDAKSVQDGLDFLHTAQRAGHLKPEHVNTSINASVELDGVPISEEGEACTSTSSVGNTPGVDAGFGSKNKPPKNKLARRKTPMETVELKVGDRVTILREGFRFGRIVAINEEDGSLVVDPNSIAFVRAEKQPNLTLGTSEVEPFKDLKSDLLSLKEALVREADGKDDSADDEEDDGSPEDDSDDSEDFKNVADQDEEDDGSPEEDDGSPEDDKDDVKAESEEIHEAFKIGDKVIPNVGPHKGVEHEVIHVHPNGEYNIRPNGVKAVSVKYHLGAARAKDNQLKGCCNASEEITFDADDVILSELESMEVINKSAIMKMGTRMSLESDLPIAECIQKISALVDTLVVEGWHKPNANSQEKRNDDRAGRKVTTPAGEGTIKAEYKRPTFSRSVPYVHEIHVQHADGSTKMHRASSCKVHATEAAAS